MPTARTPSGTRLFIQSAISASQQVSAVSKANPAVITYVGADTWTDGGYAALTEVQGMTEFSDALLRVANVNAAGNTFEAEDQDSTLYGTWVSGNASLVTLATEISVGTGIRFSGGETNFGEYTLMVDGVQRKVPTTVNGATLELDVLWDPTDAGMLALRAAAIAKAKRAFKVRFPDGMEMLFFGFVGASGLPQADNMQSIIQSKVSVVMSGLPRYVF